MSLSDLPSLDQRPRQACPKGKSRLQITADAKPLTLVDEKAFKTEIWRRDAYRCRCCHRKVVKDLKRLPERGEVHHIHGKLGDLRFESRCALLLCLMCHEKVTGRVNERIVILATRTFEIKGQRYTDARYAVRFERVA